MKIFMLFLQLSFADSFIVSPNVDLKAFKIEHIHNLWADTESKRIENTPVRSELVRETQDFLENKIHLTEYENRLELWSRSGWSEDEREILFDALTKSTKSHKSFEIWKCRLKLDDTCPRELLQSSRIPKALLEYEWLVLDGRPIPRIQWEKMPLSQSPHQWIFLSSKYKTFQFFGELSKLNLQNVETEFWVNGSCEDFQLDPWMRQMDLKIYFSQSCQKSTIVSLPPEPSFYEKNKGAIWGTLGIAAGVILLQSFKGKTFIIEKPGFM